MLDFLSISSPKRKLPHSKWNECFPYYAGFPEDFVQKIIETSGISRDSTVVDPWNGSGTTTYVASQLGYSSRGIDINPVMVLVARARSLARSESDSIEPQAKNIVKDINRSTNKILLCDPLLNWFTPETAMVIRRIEKRIRTRLVNDDHVNSEARFGKISCFAATFYVALFTICRRFTRNFRPTNPTWLRLPKNTEAKISLTSSEVSRAFVIQAKIMAESLLLSQRRTEIGVSEIYVGDTTSLSNFNYADLIITSPPYCTRIDYTAATRIELAIIDPLLTSLPEQISRKMIGSIRVPIEKIHPSEEWGQSCLDFLDQLVTHTSKASSGYYYKTHLDYFNKMYKSISNIGRIMKQDATAIFVVQDSHYKEIRNDVALILTEMADQSGLLLDRQEDYQQKNSLAGINPRTKLYRKASGATESVLCFRKKSDKATV
ncbi:hypothetical protein BH11PSE8_BH11PSE8_23950 [soil metagenome]